LGGQTYTWDEKNRWVELAEPTNQFASLVGSPFAVGSTAVGYHAYLSNENPFEELELSITPEEAKQNYIPILAAAGIQGIYDAQTTYHGLLNRLPLLYAQSLQHYEELDLQGPQFSTSEPAVDASLRWSRMALDQLKICNPYLGSSHVSGYGSSGTGTRPMYAWYFDEPPIKSWAFMDAGGATSLEEAFRFQRSTSARTEQCRMRFRKAPRSSAGSDKVLERASPADHPQVDKAAYVSWRVRMKAEK